MDVCFGACVHEHVCVRACLRVCVRVCERASEHHWPEYFVPSLGTIVNAGDPSVYHNPQSSLLA